MPDSSSGIEKGRTGARPHREYNVLETWAHDRCPRPSRIFLIIIIIMMILIPTHFYRATTLQLRTFA